MGRPTKLTPALQDELVAVLRSGVFIEAACAYVGIDRGTYHRWIAKGSDENADPIYRDFRDAVEKARAAAVVRNVALISRAAEESWQAAAWYLERSHPDQFGRRTNLAGPNGGPVQVEQTEDEAREERLRALVEQALADARNAD